jgi:tryptophanyl-tRNA synthetase
LCNIKELRNNQQVKYLTKNIPKNKMARILTGIQSTGNPGRPHLGNILGAIVPAIELSQLPQNDCYYFIADYHSLTTLREADVRKENVKNVAAAWLAFGMDTHKNTLYRQSDIPEVCELAWVLSCFTPYPMLTNAHSFKDKEQHNQLSAINAGLLNYPVLMAADILLYDANLVPVGKDQKQHLEITRDIAKTINNYYQADILIVPDAKIDQKVMTIPGIDGRKMSKSYNNFIDIFLPEKQLKKVVMSILTDSTPLEKPKNPDTCHVFAIYSLLANETQIAEMRHNYLAGNYGYGQAKTALFQLILEKYATERKKFDELLQNPDVIEQELKKGAEKARKTAHSVLKRVREATGF